MILLAVVSLLPSISGLLTDPGPLCPGDMATLTCNITGGLAQQWRYNTIEIGVAIIPRSGWPGSSSACSAKGGGWCGVQTVIAVH